MNRRTMLKAGIGSLFGLGLINAKTEAKDIEEVRTREYLDGIPVWNERDAICEMDGAAETSQVEYLFTLGYDAKSFLDSMDEGGYTYLYTPRHGMHNGRLFDLILVRIGDKNVSGRSRLRMEKE